MDDMVVGQEWVAWEINLLTADVELPNITFGPLVVHAIRIRELMTFIAEGEIESVLGGKFVIEALGHDQYDWPKASIVAEVDFNGAGLALIPFIDLAALRRIRFRFIEA